MPGRRGGHAEHIHANCDCEYAVRFDGKSGVAGYDPEKYLKMYENAEGGSSQEKINSLRRELEAGKRDEINARKREAYARKNETVYYGVPKSWKQNTTLSESEILNGTNPNYRAHIPDYLIGSNDDYKNNCTNSVVAYSMRKKGYEVTAKSVGECGTLRRGDAMFTAWDGRTPTRSKGSGLDEIQEFMKGCNNGTILAVTVKMPRSAFYPNTGHAFIAEKRDEAVLFLDPQTGTRYNKPEELFNAVERGKTLFMRVDDLEISDRGVSACKG